MAPDGNNTSLDSRTLALQAANWAHNKKALQTLVLDLTPATLIADYFVIAGGDTTVMVRAIADAIYEGISKIGRTPLSIEGKSEGRWVLLDYGDVIVHVLHVRERNFYKLEQFWNQALIVDPKEWVEKTIEMS